jgi:hypothetical protein
VREHWGLSCHQQLSLALEDKLAFTITATASYEEASALAQKWGSPVSDSALHALAQRLGARAAARRQAQLKTAPVERQPQRAPTKLAVLMLDGWQVRQRGPGWGKKRTQKPRVEWHEWKTGVYYRHEQAGRTAGRRGVLAEKIVIGWQGEPMEFGRRLHWEALRGGLGRAQAKLVVADGLGSGTWRKTAGPERAKYWTSITPANTSGIWAGRCAARTRRPPRSGSNHAVTNCGTDKSNKCWPRSLG